MPYLITSEPYFKMQGARELTVEKNSAVEAWSLVDSLIKSDERVTIRTPEGFKIDWQYLKMLADQERDTG